MTKAADREKRIKGWQQIIKEVGTDALEETPLKNAPSLLEASKRFGLDLQSPGQLRLLCIILADIVFGREKAGRKQGGSTWHPAQLYQLALREKELRTEHPDLNDYQVAAMLKDRYGYRQNAEVLRQRLFKARRHSAQFEEY